MDKPINIPFKTPLRKLRASEHVFAFSEAILPPLLPVIGGVPALVPVFTVLQNKVAHEDDIYKKIMASALTPELLFLHHQRVSAFGLFRHTVAHAEFSKVPDRLLAFNTLTPLMRTYKHAPRGSYMSVGGALSNFVIDCTKPVYVPAIQILALLELQNELKDANDEFSQKFVERASDKEVISSRGTIMPARNDTDAAFEVFVNAINSTYTINELGTKDPALKENLNKIILPVNAALTEVRNTVARRGHSSSSSDMEDDGSQTDPIDPDDPETPDDTQTPDISVPPINPEDLNPPAAGE
ncbi:MAG: DUF6261 family protein [Tannerellaceae bacterium]|jgi:hypothetical protein|nr:DUF6261 family protein [Tannerellaceae bacterium]